jgi:hypothetical protein
VTRFDPPPRGLDCLFGEPADRTGRMREVSLPLRNFAEVSARSAQLCVASTEEPAYERATRATRCSATALSKLRPIQRGEFMRFHWIRSIQARVPRAVVLAAIAITACDDEVCPSGTTEQLAHCIRNDELVDAENHRGQGCTLLSAWFKSQKRIEDPTWQG